MKLFRTILKGPIQLDQPADLPNGTRIVSVAEDEFEENYDLGDWSRFEYPHPMAP